MADELEKAIPQEILKKGGWLIVIASACANGKAGRDEREERLKAKATELNLPTDKIAVYSADQLAEWAEDYAAASSFLYGVDEGGMLSIDEWAGQEAHQIPFTAAGAIGDELTVLRDQFFNRPFETSEPRIGYVFGQAGAGKSRFVMEAIRGSESKDSTVYLPSATADQLNLLAGYLNRTKRANLIVIADEALADTRVCDTARVQVSRFDGRMRVLLIAPRVDGGAAHDVLKFKRETDDKQLAAIVAGWFPNMPVEHVSFVVNQAESNVRMARLIAEALERGDITSTSEVFKHPEITHLLDRILGSADRQALQVVAVADSVGWTGESEAEGKMIAEKLGLVWGDVQSKVYEAHRVLGIAPQAGNRRYISPAPLGKYLAQNAWAAHPTAMRELTLELPEPGRAQLIERLQDLAGHPSTEKVAREEVEQFKLLDDFRNESRARLFRSVARVLPDVALLRLKDVLRQAKPQDIKKFGGTARRELVWELDKLSWPSKNFKNAIWSLALLAGGENETISNSATGILYSRYHIFLGGTAMPYRDRLDVLDELWESGKQELVPVILGSLERAADEHVSRFDSGYSRHQVLEPEWMPKTNGENFQAVHTAIQLCERYLQDERVAQSEAACVSLAKGYVHLLDVPKLFDSISNMIKRVVVLFPKRREELRLALKRHIRWSEETHEHNKRPFPATLDKQKQLHEELRDVTFEGRITEFVGQPSWEADEKRAIEMKQLADEVFNHPDLLDGSGGAWLTAGEAADPWAFGRALAERDESDSLLSKIWELTLKGKDDRLLGGYLTVLDEKGRKEFIDTWLDEKLVANVGIDFIFSITTKLELSKNAEERILKMLTAGKVSEFSVHWLKYGGVMDRASMEMFISSLEILCTKKEWRPVALDVFAGRVAREKDIGADQARLLKVAQDLIGDVSLIHARHMSEYEWTKLAEWYMPNDPTKVAETLLDAHLGKEDGATGSWFLQHSQASKTFLEALKARPEQVWELLAKRLEGEDAFRFTIGFPEGVIEVVPAAIVMRWASKDPEKRVRYLTRIVSIDPEKQDSLGMKLLAEFGKIDNLGYDFDAAYRSGSWSGDTSDYYDRLAKRLENCVSNTKNPIILQWLQETAEGLRTDAARERDREAEGKILRGF